MVLIAVVVGYRRLHRSDEQVELARYVEIQLPALQADERPIFAGLEKLNGKPSLTPDRARALLVDELIPRLIQLGRRASEVQASTEDVRVLTRGYRIWIDRLIDACRASVRAIDDPQADPRAALQAIRARFAEADALADAWRAQVLAKCQRHRLAPR